MLGLFLAQPLVTSCGWFAQTIDPGTWGKADQATMAKRKIIKARRGAGGGAEQAAGGATAATDNSSNPFAGVSLTSPAAAVPNPFAGVSLLAAKVSIGASFAHWHTDGRLSIPSLHDYLLGLHCTLAILPIIR